MRTVRTLLAYFVLITLCLGTADYYYARGALPPIEPNSIGGASLESKLAWYELHANEIDVIYIGDSRAYCGIHADLLDPLLGTHSLNMASFANWLPTQLALVRDLVPKIPKGTTVVWSIG